MSNLYKTILVPVDGSAPSRCGIDAALDLAAALGSKVVFCAARYLFTQPWETEQQTAAVAYGHEAATKRTVPYEDFEALDEPAAAIAAAATQTGADLIVMGSHGWRGFHHNVIGSVTAAVLRHVNVPVLVVTAPVPAADGAASDRQEAQT